MMPAYPIKLQTSVRYLLLVLMLAYGSYRSQAQDTTGISGIRLNQLGFYPKGLKTAVVLAASAAAYTITTYPGNKIVFSGMLNPSRTAGLSGKKTFIANFSALQQPGKYHLNIKGATLSRPFTIRDDVYHNLAKASVKAYYYQRASVALPAQFAGKWARAAGHPDNVVLVHPSAATAKRPAGMVISSPGGWYDAGDYNKYIVNNGVTMGTLLSLCEDFPDYLKTVNLNIPESNNRIPDILDECLYNLRWMLTMQDPDDGGVYNKLTNAAFDGMVMPWVTNAPRYVVQKGTAATLDFAAVMAQASRILRGYPKELPGLADSCLTASTRAWHWAGQNPNMAYDQNAMNAKFEPKITTGGYGDNNFADELIWAAAELYISTGDVTYYKAVNILPDEQMPIPSWGNVRLLGYYSLLRNADKLKDNVIIADIETIKKRLIKLADGLINGVDEHAYQTVMGKSARDFFWGSNSVAANQSIALIQAYKSSGDKKYMAYAISNLDYLLGRNASGYSYVTGYGDRSPMHPHHRVSVADGIVEPIPGLLVAGPNPGMQDGVMTPSKVPDEAYIDDDRAYAVNEIAINWNAPLAYLVNAVEALRSRVGWAK